MFMNCTSISILGVSNLKNEYSLHRFPVVSFYALQNKPRNPPRIFKNASNDSKHELLFERNCRTFDLRINGCSVCFSRS